MKATRKLRIEQAADAIINFINVNELAIGERLPNENELAEYAKVSRSTLREAVRMLVSINVLEVRHGSGTYVGPGPNETEDILNFGKIKKPLKLVQDLFEIRYLVEPTMTAKAARYITKEQVHELEDLAKKIENSIVNETLDHLDYDIQFHQVIAKASQSIAFYNLFPIIYESIVQYNKKYSSATIKEETIISHREILDALKKGDEIAAFDAALIHIINNRRTILD